MIIRIISAIANCFYVYSILIAIRCLLTWIPGLDWEMPLFKLIKNGADVYLNLFRKIIPPLGPFDLSPMIAIFALFCVRDAFIFIIGLILRLTGYFG